MSDHKHDHDIVCDIKQLITVSIPKDGAGECHVLCNITTDFEPLAHAIGELLKEAMPTIVRKATDKLGGTMLAEHNLEPGKDFSTPISKPNTRVN